MTRLDCVLQLGEGKALTMSAKLFVLPLQVSGGPGDTRFPRACCADRETCLLLPFRGPGVDGASWIHSLLSCEDWVIATKRFCFLNSAHTLLLGGWIYCCHWVWITFLNLHWGAHFLVLLFCVCVCVRER